jgi:hypothetical protein
MTMAPDLAAPIIGWRVWVVLEEDERHRLASVFQPTLWAPRRELTGECLVGHRRLWPFWRRRAARHEAPDSSCSCGVYALKDTKQAIQYAFNAEVKGRAAIARVLGPVSLWGRVLECQRGWRAEYAYPLRIYVAAGKGAGAASGAEELAFSLTDYGVPVEIVSDWGELDRLQSPARHSHV